MVILHILTMIPRVSPFPLYQRFLNFRITLKPKSRSFESGFFFPTRKEQSRKLKKMMTLRSLTSNVSSVMANIVHASVIRNCLSVHFLITRCLWETSPVEFFPITTRLTFCSDLQLTCKPIYKSFGFLSHKRGMNGVAVQRV